MLFKSLPENQKIQMEIPRKYFVGKLPTDFTDENIPSYLPREL
jgi:RNA recognition motif-containing protein